MRNIFLTFAVFLCGVAGFGLLASPAEAAIVDWQRGADVIPRSSSDFGSASFQQSLQNLKSTGANFVAFVIPYYQTNLTSTDVQAGWNTPTDASLASAIDYAHSIGLAVTLKPHVDPYTGDWRAYINPSDRTTWFAAYSGILTHVVQIGQAHHAEMIILGTELVSMSSAQINPDNTTQWLKMIAQVRGIYTGKLTYGANSTDNSGNPYSDEKNSIGFWSALDYVGLSVYYNLNTSDNSVASLTSQWDFWNNNGIKAFAQKVGKPLIFTEIGYRSIDNAHTQPWNWGLSGNYNATEQSNDYQALMQYWNAYPYIAGVYIWNWSTDPNAGGAGDTNYTPQNKPAQQTLTTAWTTAVPAPPPVTPPPTGNAVLDMWWPSNGASVSGLQPFKGMVENLNVSQYQMYWQVDNGQLNLMTTNTTDYPHKEASVDLSSWRWQPSGHYTITFIAKDMSGTVIAQKSAVITVTH